MGVAFETLVAGLEMLRELRAEPERDTREGGPGVDDRGGERGRHVLGQFCTLGLGRRSIIYLL